MPELRARMQARPSGAGRQFPNRNALIRYLVTRAEQREMESAGGTVMMKRLPFPFLVVIIDRPQFYERPAPDGFNTE